jgi:hypothetical protein
VSIGFRFRYGTSAIPREKRELMRALANQPSRHKITENAGLSELFGVIESVFRDQEVEGSNPFTPTFRWFKPFDERVEGLSR